MADQVEQSILIKIKALVEGLNNVQTLSSSVRTLNRQQGNGLRNFGRDVDNFTVSAKDANLQAAELTTGFTKLSKTITGGNALGVFVKDLSSAAKELKAAEQSTRLLANSPFEQGLRASGGKVLSLSQAAAQLRKNEINRLSPSAELQSGLAKLDPFQSQGISLQNAARELKLYDDQVRNTTTSKKLLTFEAQKVTKSFLGMQISGKGAGAVLLNVVASATALVAILAVLGAGLVTLGFGKFVQEGIRFNGSIESAKVGMASLVASTTEIRDAQGNLVEGMDAFRAASMLAETEVKKIQKAAIDTSYEFEDILLTVNSAIAAGAGANITIAETVSLVTTLSRAASAINLNPEKFNTQVKQILGGATTLRTDLARVLFPGMGTRQINDTLKEWRKAGTIYDELTKKARIYQLTANDVANTFAALSNNFSDAFSQLAADSTLELFDSLKRILREIIYGIVDFKSETVKLTPPFQIIADFLNRILGVVGGLLLNATKSLLQSLSNAANYIKANQAELEKIAGNLINIGLQIVGFITDFLRFVGLLGDAGVQTGALNNILLGIAVTLGFIRDLAQFIRGVLLYIAGLAMGQWISALDKVFYVFNQVQLAAQAVANYTGLASSNAESLAQRFQSVANVLSKITGASAVLSLLGFFGDNKLTEQGLNEMRLALSGANTNQAFNTYGGLSGGLGFSSADNYSFKPTRNTSDDKSGRDKARRELEQRMAAVRKLLDADADYRINQAKRIFEDEKAINQLVIENTRRRYDDGLISAENYYNEQSNLREKDLAAEEKYLKRRSELEEVKSRREIATFFGKADFSDAEYQSFQERFAKASANGFDDTDKTFLKASTEYIKSLDQDREIQQRLRAIERERTQNAKDRTYEIDKQTRALSQQIQQIEGDLESAFDRDSAKELIGIYQRISDELPKLLTSTNSGEGISRVAEQIRALGAVDPTTLRSFFADAGIEVTSLSQSTQSYIRLIERLIFLANNKALSQEISRIQDNLAEDSRIVSDDADRGVFSRERERAELLKLNSQAAQDLRIQLEALDAEMAKNPASVTDEDRRSANRLRRRIPQIESQGLFDSLNNESQETQNRFEQRRIELQQQFNNDKLTEIELRNHAISINLEEKAALDSLIAQLEAVKNKTIEQEQALLGLKNRSAELGVVTDVFAQQINGVLGDSIDGIFDVLTSGTENVGQAFQKLLSSMLINLGKVIFQAVVLQSILKLLGIGNTGSGGFGGFLSGILGVAPQKKADGGFLSGAGTSKSDSIPLLGSHGEAVIPVSSVKLYGRSMIQSIIDGRFMPSLKLADGGIVGSLNDPAANAPTVSNKTRILNILDKSLVKDFLQSSDGEEIILNTIAANGGKISQLLV